MNNCNMCGGETKIDFPLKKASLGPTLAEPLMSKCIICGFKQEIIDYILEKDLK